MSNTNLYDYLGIVQHLENTFICFAAKTKKIDTTLMSVH